MEQQVAVAVAEHNHALDMAFALFGMLLSVLGMSKQGTKVKLLNIEIVAPSGWRRTLCLVLGLTILLSIGIVVYMQEMRVGLYGP